METELIEAEVRSVTVLVLFSAIFCGGTAVCRKETDDGAAI